MRDLCEYLTLCDTRAVATAAKFFKNAATHAAFLKTFRVFDAYARADVRDFAGV
jgi:hypothetical protein